MKRNKDWQHAEDIVKSMCGGAITPGSGSGRIKGDVRVGRTAIIEVKQSDQIKLTIQRRWFDKLVDESGAEQLIVAMFFQLRGYTYWFTEDRGCEQRWEDPREEWSTMTVKEDSLPFSIMTKDGWWELRPLQSLRELKQ